MRFALRSIRNITQNFRMLSCFTSAGNLRMCRKFPQVRVDSDSPLLSHKRVNSLTNRVLSLAAHNAYSILPVSQRSPCRRRFMATLNQRRKMKKPQKEVIPREKRVLRGPQRKAVCVKVFIRKPKKPNSANRKCALLRLSDGRLITAYIPGEKASLQEHGVVLIEGGRTRDLPGVKYKVIRRKYDCN